MLLSIIVPTYNRAFILPYSLSLIDDQIRRYEEEVELVICNNASTDDTEELISNYVKDRPYARFINYQDHKDIGVSIARSIDNALGDYFLLWGDDDIPSPHMIDYFISVLKTNPDAGCVVCNRMQSWDCENFTVTGLSVINRDFDRMVRRYDSIKEFITDHFREMTFLSVDLIAKDAWDEGKKVYSVDDVGFEYLVPFLYGQNGKKCVYITYPLCIQRLLHSPVYASKWALYFYVGIPRILVRLQSFSLIEDWHGLFDDYQYNKSDVHFIRLMLNSAKDKVSYIGVWRELCSYQKSYLRKFFILSIPAPRIFLFIWYIAFVLYYFYSAVIRITKRCFNLAKHILS